MKTQVTINWAPKADYQDRNKVIKYINKAAIVNAVTEAQSALSEYDSERPDGSPDMMAKAQLFDEYQRLVALYNRVIAGEVDKVEEPEPEVEIESEKGNIYELRLKMIANSLKGFVDGSSVGFMNEIRDILNEGYSVDQLLTEVRPYVAEQFGKRNTYDLISMLRMAIGEDNGETFLRNYEEGVRGAKKARKSTPKAKADKPAKEAKAESHGNRADAQDRLDRYTAELAEKEALLKADQFLTKDDRKACVKRIASLNRKIARANRALGNGAETTTKNE